MLGKQSAHPVQESRTILRQHLNQSAVRRTAIVKLNLSRNLYFIAVGLLRFQSIAQHAGHIGLPLNDLSNTFFKALPLLQIYLQGPKAVGEIKSINDHSRGI